MPAAAFDEVFHLLVLAGIIFLHPCVFHTSFEVEHIVGEFFQQEEVLVDGVPYIFLDGGLYVPVPLCVKMGVGHHIGFGPVLCGVAGICLGSGLASGAHRHGSGCQYGNFFCNTSHVAEFCHG